MKRYDNPSMALDMEECAEGEYVKYSDALRLAKWCVDMADEHGGDYCRVRSQAFREFPELKES